MCVWNTKRKDIHQALRFVHLVLLPPLFSPLSLSLTFSAWFLRLLFLLHFVCPRAAFPPLPSAPLLLSLRVSNSLTGFFFGIRKRPNKQTNRKETLSNAPPQKIKKSRMLLIRRKHIYTQIRCFRL